MKPRFIYVLSPFLNFDFISKLNWKFACNIQMTELEGKPNTMITHTLWVG